MALDRRLAGGRLHLLVGEARQALLAARTGHATMLRLARPSPAVLVVPWGSREILRVTLFTALATVSAVVSLLIARLVFSLGFFFAEGLRIIPTGTFTRLDSAVAPYGVAVANALTAAVFCGALVRSIRVSILRRHGIPWSSIGLVHCERKFMQRAMLLFLPVTALGALVARLGEVVARSRPHDIVPSLLTNGVAVRPLNVILICAVLVVLAPIAEEILFRGVLFRFLRGRLTFLPAACLSAVPCAVLHLSPMELPWLMAMGLVYAYLAEQSRSLYPGMVLHCLTNGLATIALVAMMYGL
jgi:membrane protease YdiL (CAAX protease family)